MFKLPFRIARFFDKEQLMMSASGSFRFAIQPNVCVFYDNMTL